MSASISAGCSVIAVHATCASDTVNQGAQTVSIEGIILADGDTLCVCTDDWRRPQMEAGAQDAPVCSSTMIAVLMWGCSSSGGTEKTSEHDRVTEKA